jgi:WD40 repeat protein
MITFRPSRTVVTSFHPRQRHERTSGESVVTVAQQSTTAPTTSATNDAAAADVLVCALHNGAIKLYDRSTLRLISTMQAEADVVHVCFSSPSVVVAASQNGTVTAFDLRQQHQQQPLSARNNGYGDSPSGGTITSGVLQHRITAEGAISSMDYCSESSTIALGGSHGIYLWDWRHPNHVALLGDTHQNITQVRFVQRNRLVSTGDSLLCWLDCTMASERALCIMYTGKTSHYKKLGLCGDNGTVVYCVSTENTVALWDLAKGQCFHQTGIHHLRQKARSTSSFLNTIVDCAFDLHSQTLSLLASNYSGDAVIFSLPNVTAYHAHWQATQRLVGGHRGVVTAWCGNLTGGSDARVCEWMPVSSTNAASAAVQPEAMISTSHCPLQPSKRQRYDAE